MTTFVDARLWAGAAKAQTLHLFEHQSSSKIHSKARFPTEGMMISLFGSSRGRRRREPVEGVLFTTGGNGVASVEVEEDEEELLDEDDDDEDTELSSSSFSGRCEGPLSTGGTIFAGAFVCMGGGGTSSGVSFFGLFSSRFKSSDELDFS